MSFQNMISDPSNSRRAMPDFANLSTRDGVEMTLRLAAPHDDEFLMRVYGSTRTAELAMVPWPIEQKAAFIAMQHRAQQDYYGTRFPDASQWVIETGGEAAGRLYLEVLEEEIHILDLTILDGFQGRGIGTAILERIVTAARNNQVPVRIFVETSGGELPLYESLGFRPDGPEGAAGLRICMVWRPVTPSAS